jgi:hypothetical protein
MAPLDPSITQKQTTKAGKILKSREVERKSPKTACASHGHETKCEIPVYTGEWVFRAKGIHMQTPKAPKSIALASALLAVTITGSAARGEGTPVAQPMNTPLMSLMDRFIAAEAANPTIVPAPKPAAKPSTKPPAPTPTPVPAPDPLPGRGLAEHPLLYIGEWCKNLLVVHNGKVIWTYAAEGKGEYEEGWMLSNGNILFARLIYVAEVTPEKRIVWKYDAPKGTEIATCQPIGPDKVMFVQNGKPPKLIVMNKKNSSVEFEHEIPYDLTKGSVHTQFRRARYTPQDTYLVAYNMMDQVVEFDKNFNEIWKYEVHSPCAVVRLKNGNTLIINERDVTILEVNRAKEIVWQLKPSDLPELMQFKYAKTCTRLANGNTIVCTQVGRGNPPQLVEVNKEKKVVWMLRDWVNFGGSTAIQVLDDPGIPENPGESEH